MRALIHYRTFLKIRLKICLKLCVPALILLGLNANAQQKAMYSQYMFNGLALNPAYSATDEALTISTLYRQQWVGLKGAPNTQTFAIHSPVKASNSSLGAMLIRDQIGEVIKETGAYVTLAQRVALNEKTFLAVGFNAGATSFQGDYAANYQASPQSMNDPMFENQSQMRVNLGVGVVLFSPKYYLGISSPHLFYRPMGASLSNLKASTTYRPHYIIQGGYLIKLGGNLMLKPHIILNYVNGSPLSADFNGSLIIAETLWLGASYRAFDSFNAIMQVAVTKNLAVGYSYDYTSTELSQVQQGSHEISLKFRLPIRGREFPKCFF
ncbi:MAG TPA: type IX secretion system membrane protein PorP/SprF [Pedobacter sp.]|jgi:type IX secretion system PorP/SprF family membrane protein